MVSLKIGMLAHPKAAAELQAGLVAIKPIMTDPTVSRDKKRSALNMMVNELSDSTFKLKSVAQMIMTIINMKEAVCHEYADSEDQTAGILEWLPRFTEHQSMLLATVKRHRKEYGLKV